jgi:hypothetical protein
MQPAVLNDDFSRHNLYLLRACVAFLQTDDARWAAVHAAATDIEALLSGVQLAQLPPPGTRIMQVGITASCISAKPIFKLGSHNRNRELFLKNTGLCNVETLSIKPDACPVSGDTHFLYKRAVGNSLMRFVCLRRACR